MSHRDLDFEIFTTSVGANAYQKLTGQHKDKLESWSDLFAKLIVFGRGNSLERRKLFDSVALGDVGFFSSSEQLIAVPLLLRADLGELADKFAKESQWWSHYDRTADSKTRSIISTLLGN